MYYMLMCKRRVDGNLLPVLNSHIVDYPTPGNLNYNWSFGSAAGLCLALQLVTGIFLAMHYTANIDLAFSCVEFIMRDVQGGWWLRYAHANGASFFFVLVYTHMLRGLFYASYEHPRHLLWWSGLVVFIAIMAIAFMGYVLPWGQMSFWGVTVITSLFSAIPKIGKPIVLWLWGGFSINNATLSRFFSFHYTLPFVLTALVLWHLALLHTEGSNNPLGLSSKGNQISFYPYFYVKDLLAFFLWITVWCLFLYYGPNILGHSTNYIIADPLKTPPHIVPEWYFLPYYAILRSIPHKLGGVVGMGASLFAFALLPLVSIGLQRSSSFRPFYMLEVGLFVGCFLVLGWGGQVEVKDHYILMGQIVSVIYFILLTNSIPGARLEKYF